MNLGCSVVTGDELNRMDGIFQNISAWEYDRSLRRYPQPAGRHDWEGGRQIGPIRVILLRKRSNLRRLLHLLSKSEPFNEFCLVNRRPLDNQSKCTRRNTPFQYGKILNVYYCSRVAIHGMKMRRRMITKVDLYDDSVKTGNLRHELQHA